MGKDIVFPQSLPQLKSNYLMLLLRYVNDNNNHTNHDSMPYS